MPDPPDQTAPSIQQLVHMFFIDHSLSRFLLLLLRVGHILFYQHQEPHLDSSSVQDSSMRMLRTRASSDEMKYPLEPSVQLAGIQPKCGIVNALRELPTHMHRVHTLESVRPHVLLVTRVSPTTNRMDRIRQEKHELINIESSFVRMVAMVHREPPRSWKYWRSPQCRDVPPTSVESSFGDSYAWKQRL